MNKESKKNLSNKLHENLEFFKMMFTYPINIDFVVRELEVTPLQTKGAMLFIDGMVKSDTIYKYVITPLIETKPDVERTSGKSLKEIMNNIIRIAEVDISSDIDDITRYILKGKTVLLVDGYSEVVVIKTIGAESRSVEKPENEPVVRGPHEAFAENLRTNRGLIRKHYQDVNLVTEIITVGKKAPTDIGIMYVKDIADPDLVERVRKRIKEISMDTVLTSSMLEQHLEEKPYSLIPTTLFTERPDRATSFLREGHIVIIDQTPGVIIVPITFWSFFHTPEDMYLKWAYGNFIRLIRLFSYLVALLLPALYVATTTYHSEMIPTDLLIALAGSREVVPFGAFFEVLILEVAFELVREAGKRTPATFGSTIGIVGALILGQAAVEANVVSPMIVIIVSITALSSFVLGENSANYMVRITRFIFLFFAVALGFLGISICLTVFAGFLVSTESFGVPFYSPVSPHRTSSGDTFIRPPVWKQWLRPHTSKQQDLVRADKPDGSE